MSSPGLSHEQEDTSSNLETNENSPEHESMISMTSYAEMQEIIENFINSKRFARDAENNYNFLTSGPRSNCARVDAVYSVRAGAKGHIKVQDKDQYWAEEERKFPHLKEIHELEEMMSTGQAAVSSSSVTQVAVDHLQSGDAVNPSILPNKVLLMNEDNQLTPAKDVEPLTKTRELQKPPVPTILSPSAVPVKPGPSVVPAKRKHLSLPGNQRQFSPTHSRQSVPTNPRHSSVPAKPRQFAVPTKPRQFAVPTNSGQFAVPTNPRHSPVPTNPRQFAVPTNPRHSPVPTNSRQFAVPTNTKLAGPPPRKKPKLMKTHKILPPQRPSQR